MLFSVVRASIVAENRVDQPDAVLRIDDENAFALGGAAGHAGLFGTIDGVQSRRIKTPNANVGNLSIKSDPLKPQ